jgi:hypothetical protein
MRIVTIIIYAIAAPRSPRTLTCSTWQQITTCSSPDGYLSHEWDRDGMRFGDVLLEAGVRRRCHRRSSL